MPPAMVKTLAALLAQMLVADLRLPSLTGPHTRGQQPPPELTMPTRRGRTQTPVAPDSPPRRRRRPTPALRATAEESAMPARTVSVREP